MEAKIKELIFIMCYDVIKRLLVLDISSYKHLIERVTEEKERLLQTVALRKLSE